MGLFHRTALPVAAMLLATLSFSANVVYSQDASDTLPFPILPPHTFTALTPEQLTAVDPFPDHYPNLPPAEQRQWVEQQLVQVTDPPTQYKLLQERAYLLIIGNHLPAVRQQCRLHEPLTFDFRYRFRCLAVGSFAYDISVLKWLDLYENTIAEDRTTPSSARAPSGAQRSLPGRG